MIRSLHPRSALAALAALLGWATCSPAPSPPADTGQAAQRWWKGNLHAHSLWSDGDAFPEMVADGYRGRGYHFLVLSDHNVPPEEKWIAVGQLEDGAAAYERYVARFGGDWVQESLRGDSLYVRLRTLEEYRPLLENPGAFLLVRGEEITEYVADRAAHVNAIHIADWVAPQGGATVRAILRSQLEAVRAQRERTGRPMIAHVNHPNWLWSLTAEDLIESGARFFEVYNGHPDVNNGGDSIHPGTDRLWDIVLTERLLRGGEPIYGVATDDAHDYHTFGPRERNPGRGWVQVRAPELSAEAIVRAMEAGRFYASTGVELEDVRREDDRIIVRIRAEDGVRYTTRFIGTRTGVGVSPSPVALPDGSPVTPRYGPEVGAILDEVEGRAPVYRITGGEMYVRAKVTSTKRRTNPTGDTLEVAWTQPSVIREP